MRTLALGFALFSMFFGAGNLVFPLVLGHMVGDQSWIAIIGLCVTAVAFPLLGLLGMMVCEASYKRFFGRIGKIPGFLVLLLVQLVLTPFGSVPRLFTLAHATLEPYFNVSLFLFILISCGVVFAFTVRKQRIVDILGYVLTPILLLSLAAIIILGLVNHPAPQIVTQSAGASLFDGLRVGYNTLDLLAALLFARLIYSKEPSVKPFLKASLIATGLLGAVYGGLALVASYHAHTLGPVVDEKLLSAIARHLLGAGGGLIASVAVVMACLTTAISLCAIFAEYLRENITRNRIGPVAALVITLAISGGVATMGFSGIMRMLGPIVKIAYPGLIILALWNLKKSPQLAAPSAVAEEAVEG